MFNIGDTIIYSTHGICEIDDVCEKTFGKETKKYYELHPINDPRLSISIPVDSDKVIMLEVINKDEAEDILQSFTLEGTEWIESSSERVQVYSDAVRKGNRMEISKILNTLIAKKKEIEAGGKKFHVQDKKLLAFIENILFTELSFSLDTTFEDINKRVYKLINVSNG